MIRRIRLTVEQLCATQPEERPKDSVRSYLPTDESPFSCLTRINRFSSAGEPCH